MQASGSYHYPLYRAYAGGVFPSITPNVISVLAIELSTLILKYKKSTSLTSTWMKIAFNQPYSVATSICKTYLWELTFITSLIHQGGIIHILTIG